MAFKSTVLVFLLILCQTVAFAASTSASIAVGATVASSCLVSPSSMPTANYAVRASAQSAVTVACSSFTPYTVTLVQRPNPLLIVPKGSARGSMSSASAQALSSSIYLWNQSPGYFSISRAEHAARFSSILVTADKVTVEVTY